MKRITKFILLVVLTWPSVAKADDLSLNAASFERWKKFILPSEDDLAYLEIKWRSSLSEAVAEAKRVKKPVLLWGMNGNPLSGCT